MNKGISVKRKKLWIDHGALLQKEMNNRISPLAKQVCGNACGVPFLEYFKHNSLPLNFLPPEQCDQMARLFVQYLALYNDALLPNSIKNCQSRFPIKPNIK